MSIALLGALAILAVEICGGLLSHSLALLADGAHMATDAAAAGVALWAAAVAQRPADRRRTFGYGRSKVLGALLNGATLIAVVIYIAWEAVRRFGQPQSVASDTMLAVGVVALVANLLLTWFLMSSEKGSLNVRAVTVHIVGDAFASAGVIVSALVIKFTDLVWVDPAVSLAIGVMVAWSAYGVVRDSVNVLMEGVPDDLDVETMRREVATLPEVLAVHDLHVWCATGGAAAASLHVRVHESDLRGAPTLVSRIKASMHDRFSVEHATVEVECDDCGDACE